MFGLPGDVALPPPPLAVASLEVLLVGKPLPALMVAEVTEFRHTPTYFGIYMNLSREETGEHFCKGHTTLLHTEMSPEPVCRMNFAWILGFAGVDFLVNFHGCFQSLPPGREALEKSIGNPHRNSVRHSRGNSPRNPTR